MRLRSTIAAALCAAFVLPASASALVPSTPDGPAITVNAGGNVDTIVRLGDTIYLGGSFTDVNGHPRLNLAAINAVDGTLSSWAPTANGEVNAMVASGSTIYIGGLFGQVSDTSGPAHARNGLAAIDTAGNVTSWDPDAGIGQVWALAMSGSRVYVGGSFSTLGPAGPTQITEDNVGVVDAGSGVPIAWTTSPPNPNNTVLALDVSPDGTELYVGGSFGQIGPSGSIARLGVAAVQATTGVVDPSWDPSDLNGGSGADDFAVAPNGDVYIVGDFFPSGGSGNSMGFQPRYYVAELEPAGGGRTGQATSFAPDVDSEAFSIAPAPDAVYIGGFFSFVNTTRTAAARDGLAAVDLGIGDVLGWNPGAGSNVKTLFVAPDGSLYAGGTFTGGFISFSPPPVATANPEVQGTPQPSQVLTCTQGTWSGATPQIYASQFTSDGAPVGAAGSTTYNVTDADVGHAIGCAVTAHNRRADITASAAAVTIQALPLPAPAAVTPPQPSTLPAPAFRRTANLYPQTGTVLVKIPGTGKYVPISQPEQIPFGSIIDARHGTVRICTTNRAGKIDCSDFFGGIFKLTQTGGAHPLTVLTLVGGNFKVCPRTKKARRATDAAKRKVKPSKSVRHLWGSGTGPFRSVGRYASATIRGTTWLTDDRCDGTLIRVKRGVVTVRDLVKGKQIALKAPRRYLAAAGKLRRG